ncbi:LPS assembly lipoprotein LptE [Rhodoferax sp.]|uniref:LPS-assembly lipoprotein LptE n=1 Tax=Rhodoferax sp. TaxID=50421 RepID=UPI00275F6352|nr:LPS assembly lipoprotein LptE [Rhodoferax sp.]
MGRLNRRVWLGKGLGLLGTGGLLSACGFKLRGAERFAFQTISITPQPGGALASELRSTFARALPAPQAGVASTGVVLDLLEEQREKVVVGRGSAGQVREYQLRIKAVFRVRTMDGRDLIAATEIAQHRDISFSESAVLAKEAEETILYRDMQRDIVRQILRRVAAIQSL